MRIFSNYRAVFVSSSFRSSSSPSWAAGSLSWVMGRGAFFDAEKSVVNNVVVVGYVTDVRHELRGSIEVFDVP